MLSYIRRGAYHPPPLWFVRAPAPLSLQRCLFTRDDFRVCGSRSDLFSHVFFWHLVELMSSAVRCPVFQHGKRRTSRSIRQRYRCLVDSSTRFYLLQPFPKTAFSHTASGISQTTYARLRSRHQKTTDIPISTFADSKQFVFPSCRVFTRHKAQVRRKLATVFEILGPTRY